MTDKHLAGQARLAADILVEIWEKLRPYDDYNTIWEAKEYLQEAADTLEQDG